ncbi:MAG: hypothetical protein ABIG44_11155 [Planctomycetota bacterium]
MSVPDPSQPGEARQPTDAGQEGPTPAQLKNAMKAFKKRLKLARLDAESGLGHGATSSGRRSGIVAIRPPDRYPPEVWAELHRLGKLKYAGEGLFELA